MPMELRVSLTFIVPLVYHLQSYQMANRVQIPTNNSALIAMIADEVRVWQCHICFLYVLTAEEQILHVCGACPLDFFGTFRISVCED